jgi:hypothetical protein
MDTVTFNRTINGIYDQNYCTQVVSGLLKFIKVCGRAEFDYEQQEKLRVLASQLCGLIGDEMQLLRDNNFNCSGAELAKERANYRKLQHSRNKLRTFLAYW